MPIYAYKCESCGFAKDVLQKMSDSPLTDCPTCGVSAFRKQLTAAGFQLKGSGWYATDFKGAAPAAATAAASSDAAPTVTATTDTAKSQASSAAKSDAAAPSAAGGSASA